MRPPSPRPSELLPSKPTLFSLFLVLVGLGAGVIGSHAHASAATIKVVSVAERVFKPGDVFTLDGKRATAAFLATRSGVDPEAVPDAPMLRTLAGVQAEVSLRELGQLRRAAKAADHAPENADFLGHLVLTRRGERAEIRLYAPRAAPDLVLVVGQPSEGVEGAPPPAAQIPRVRAEAAFGPLSPIDAAGQALPVGELVDLPGPYLSSDLTLSGREIRERFQPGKYIHYSTSGPSRKLEREQMWVRLPKDHDLRVPTGLVVWISPMPNWRIPPHFAGVLDELGFIAAGVDNTGNKREFIDRMQLQLDAIATVSARYAVDPDRVYLTGFSGGGRTSSILLGTYPERFAGALPIVGLSSQHEVPVENGKIIPASYKHPKGKRLSQARQRRIFAISGTRDFNLVEMRARTERLTALGVPIRLEVVNDMPHEQMPPAELVAQGVRWIDEPRRDAIKENERSAREVLREVESELASESPSDKQRAQLVEVCRIAPWGQSAWRAAALLGYERAAD